MGKKIRGFIRDLPGGTALAGISVSLKRHSDNSAIGAGTTTAGDGSYEFDLGTLNYGLNPGPVYVEATYNGQTKKRSGKELHQTGMWFLSDLQSYGRNAGNGCITASEFAISSGGANSVTIGTGTALVDGCVFNLTSAYTLALDPALPPGGQSRIDRIILRQRGENYTAPGLQEIVSVKGADGASPAVPSYAVPANTTDLEIARVTVNSAGTVSEVGSFTRPLLSPTLGAVVAASLNATSVTATSLTATSATIGSGTGLAKLTAGVVSAGASGTDYAPATSGTSILKGNGSGGFANAAASTDYAPATSGTSILKGNGTGGFANAAASTDYAPATSGTSILKGNGSGGFANAASNTDYLNAASPTLASGNLDVGTGRVVGQPIGFTAIIGDGTNAISTGYQSVAVAVPTGMDVSRLQLAIPGGTGTGNQTITISVTYSTYANYPGTVTGTIGTLTLSSATKTNTTISPTVNVPTNGYVRFNVTANGSGATKVAVSVHGTTS